LGIFEFWEFSNFGNFRILGIFEFWRQFHGEIIMHFAKKASLGGLAVLASLALAPAAWAGCGDYAIKQPASWDGKYNGGLFRQTDYEESSIVGMWDFKFFAGTTMIDFGYAQWHSDHTELMNSGTRAPATQNFCMGVWKKTGPSRYHLNHFALSYDLSGHLDAKVNIQEDVVVDADGRSYSGSFTIDVYAPAGGNPVQHVDGQVTATRVTAN
jgi:hypothetical protein